MFEEDLSAHNAISASLTDPVFLRTRSLDTPATAHFQPVRGKAHGSNKPHPPQEKE